MWVENKVEKGVFFNEIKGGTERTGVQRFGTRYVEIKRLSMRRPCKRCYSAHHRISSNCPHRYNLV